MRVSSIEVSPSPAGVWWSIRGASRSVVAVLISLGLSVQALIHAHCKDLIVAVAYRYNPARSRKHPLITGIGLARLVSPRQIAVLRNQDRSRSAERPLNTVRRHGCQISALLPVDHHFCCNIARIL